LRIKIDVLHVKRHMSKETYHISRDLSYIKRDVLHVKRDDDTPKETDYAIGLC